ncbi:hypothetical protein MKX01_017343 [Papaver californicum]|nr:hypothetical protein MKX01_017343 [Papaver californicum]
MAKTFDRSFVNTEVHRFKNRVRQQRYRSRKREEKAKREGQTLLPSCLFITDSASASNGLDVIHSNAECVGARSVTSVEHRYTSKTSEETNVSQIRPAVKSQYEQPCPVELAATVAEENLNTSSEPYQAFHAHMIQDLPQMETGHCINILKAPDNSSVKLPYQREVRRSHEDILARRAKNRERQRRYRARKRLETDMKKVFSTNQPNSLSLQIPNRSGFINRVLFHRDWKEEARQVHVSEEPEISQAEPPLASLNSLGHENLSTLPSENKKQLEEKKELKPEQQLNGNVRGANQATHNRRDWKMAARNKVH